jgi:hypothetical protein
MIDQSIGIRALALILENPFAEKGYRELHKYYQDASMVHEANCIDELIKEKSHAGSSANNEQRINNQKDA